MNVMRRAICLIRGHRFPANVKVIPWASNWMFCGRCGHPKHLDGRG